jgi:ATP-dependent Clp protease adaptor protein ClpS
MSQLPDDRPAGSRPRPSFRPVPLPRYRVVLRSGPTPDMMFIVHTLMDLTRFGLAEAMHKMWESHHYGRSVLLVTHKERAELYAEQFSAKGLSVALELAP